MSIQNIGRNKWRVVVRTNEIDSKTGQYKRTNRHFDGTKNEARAFERQLEMQYQQNITVAPDLTVGEFLNSIWLPSLELDPTTITNYTNGTKYLKGLFEYPLTELTARIIEKEVHALPAGSIRQLAHKTLSKALNTAVRWDCLPYNPLTKAQINFGKSLKRDLEAYSKEEFEEVLEAFRDKPAEAVVIIMGNSGLRKEEALALTWSDIDLDTGVISVTKSWTKGSSNKGEIKPTKTSGSLRDVYIGGKTLQRLQELGLGKEGPLWLGNDKLPISPDAATRNFKRRIDATGLRYIPLGALRHTYATLAIAAGIDISIISRNLGHVLLSTTVNTYIKPLEAARKEAATTFAAAMDSFK